MRILLMGALRGSSWLCVNLPATIMEEISSSMMATSTSPLETGEGEGTSSEDPLEMGKISQSMHNVSVVKFVCLEPHYSEILNFSLLIII